MANTVKFQKITDKDKILVHQKDNAGLYSAIGAINSGYSAYVFGNKIGIGVDLDTAPAFEFFLADIDKANCTPVIAGTVDTISEMIIELNTNFFFSSTDSGGSYQPLSEALTEISILVPTNNDFLQFKSNAWANRTIAQVKTDLAINIRTGDSRYYGNAITAVALGNLVLTTAVLRASPFIVSRRMTINEVRSEVTTTLAGSYRVGIYNDDGNCYPSTLIAGTDTGEFDSGSGTIKNNNISPSVILEPGLYWIAYACSSASTLRSVGVGGIPNVLGMGTSLGANSQSTGWSVAFVYAALPTPFPAGATVFNNTACPLVVFRAI
jgi:hypothetical protein